MAGPVTINLIGLGSLWASTPTDASTPSITLAGAKLPAGKKFLILLVFFVFAPRVLKFISSMVLFFKI
jgi:hypothetical protein